MKAWVLASVLAVLGTGAATAQGGGSLGLDDVLEAVKADPKLVAEINDELNKNGLKVDGVVCTGFRHANQWTELSGARAAPYECDIGKRQIVIRADRMYFDAGKRPIGDMKRANPKRADSFKETNFRWTWKPVK
ncbi:hypothetical protein [Pseudorhodoplanes sp.]|uniref:hypothetical protein n=1 Tax=Pseudorhodoplanes sp. TaxID=1934341 RepID=UPI002BE056A0|nr:hypothetical protein [Pseudorhodoplanes sp.]HWV51087.1 hypothetical protein [Pseudorhodoplanes sp.]